MLSRNMWQSERVRLRAIEPEDADTFYEWNLDTEMAGLLYRVQFPQSREAAKRWAQDMSARRSEDDTFFWVIENMQGEFVGTISTHQCERRSGTFKYGLAIRREHQRKGYAAEAIRLVLRYYFREMRYQKVVAEVYSFNEPSIRLHERMGFMLEGRLRRMIYSDGQWHDELLFGMTMEEFGAAESR